MRARGSVLGSSGVNQPSRKEPHETRRRIPSPRPGVITAVVCLALAAVVAAMASLNVALPDIARDTTPPRPN